MERNFGLNALLHALCLTTQLHKVSCIVHACQKPMRKTLMVKEMGLWQCQHPSFLVIWTHTSAKLYLDIFLGEDELGLGMQSLRDGFWPRYSCY